MLTHPHDCVDSSPGVVWTHPRLSCCHWCVAWCLQVSRAALRGGPPGTWLSACWLGCSTAPNEAVQPAARQLGLDFDRCPMVRRRAGRQGTLVCAAHGVWTCQQCSAVVGQSRRFVQIWRRISRWGWIACWSHVWFLAAWVLTSCLLCPPMHESMGCLGRIFPCGSVAVAMIVQRCSTAVKSSSLGPPRADMLMAKVPAQHALFSPCRLLTSCISGH